jgi:exodeoxyribonuclease VII small subunit
MSKKEITYVQLAQQLDDILNKINAGEVPLEELEAQLATAKSLLKQCQDKLRGIEQRLMPDDED